MKGLLLIILVIAFNDARSPLKYQQRLLTLRGRVVFPTGSNIPIETDGELTVELQDTSLADAPAKVIAKSTGLAIEFPMAFAIKYHPEDIVEGMRYSLQATVRNKKMNYFGIERTKTIDVPVILVKRPSQQTPKTKWAELVGKNGAEAVEIIKKQTGFTNVMTVNEKSAITMDYRTDRVRVFVNDRGIVSRVPTIA